MSYLASGTSRPTSVFSATWMGSSTDLVVNEIGAFTGTVRWTAGPSLVEVSADGN